MNEKQREICAREKITEKDRATYRRILKTQLNMISTPTLAKAITATVFRNGIVEDIHASGKLDDDDMMQLNIDICNRIGQMLTWYREGKYLSISKYLNFGALCTSQWDDPCEPDDMKDVEDEFDYLLIQERKHPLMKSSFERYIQLPNQRSCFTLTSEQFHRMISDALNICDHNEDCFDYFYVSEKDGDITIETEIEDLAERLDLGKIILDTYNVIPKTIREHFDEESGITEWWIEYIKL